MILPQSAYSRLLRAYGPQGWWPVTSRGAAKPSYRSRASRGLSEEQRAEVCMGAILTQNTAWSNAEKALGSLRGAGARSLERVAAMPLRRLAGLIRSSGYFRQKAVKMRVFSRHALSKGQRISRWLASPLLPLREELLRLWGVGPETADSILLYAGGRPVFVIDAYTLRIGSRLGWWKKPGYERAQRYLESRLPHSAPLYNEFHALFVRLAKEHCRKTPSCPGCPLRGDCRYGRRHG